MADELHDALRRAGIQGPYILVGNAFGGDPARTFAMRYTSETAGLVLAEADASDLEPKAMRDDDHSGNAAYVPRVRKCRDAVAAGTALPPLSNSHPDRTCDRQFFRGLPESEWSPELNASLMRLARTKPAMYDAAISEMEQMPWDEAWLEGHGHSLGSRPVRVLTTGNHAVSRLPAADARDPKHIEYERQIALAQARWLSLSSNARQTFPSNSSEYIGFDAPDAVVGAIREVYDQSKGH
jgi:pimeloyl-ACP methyl ester carboxylesterase